MEQELAELIHAEVSRQGGKWVIELNSEKDFESMVKELEQSGGNPHDGSHIWILKPKVSQLGVGDGYYISFQARLVGSSRFPYSGRYQAKKEEIDEARFLQSLSNLRVTIGNVLVSLCDKVAESND